MKETRLLIMIMSCLEQQQYPILSSRACFSNPRVILTFCEESLAFRFISPRLADYLCPLFHAPFWPSSLSYAREHRVGNQDGHPVRPPCQPGDDARQPQDPAGGPQQSGRQHPQGDGNYQREHGPPTGGESTPANIAYVYARL